MTLSRDEACMAYAHAIGAECITGFPGGVGRIYKVENGKRMFDYPIPAPDAPPHEHLAFVGRIAEAIKTNVVAVDMRHHEFKDVGPIAVTFKHENGWCYSDDLCHAALLAALAALESR